MKKNFITFYFLIVLLIILILFFVVPSLKFKGNNEGKNTTIETTAKNITVNVKSNTVSGNANNNQARTLVLSEEDKKIMATLVKEDPPKDINNIKLTRLNVPVFQQEYSRSCEEASLRMVLAFYGIQTNDMEIVKRVGYDPHPWDIKNNIWDDPNKMFVGYIDDPNKSGYGTFAPAIAVAAKTFGQDAESYQGVSSQFLAQQIYNGYPVIVWGFFSSPPFTIYSWHTKDGKKITAYRGEHVRVIVGVYGDSYNPVGFLLNDPLTGEKDQYWSTERLITQMNMFSNLTNQVVVVK